MAKALVMPWETPDGEQKGRDQRATGPQKEETAADQAAQKASNKTTQPFPPEYHVG